MNHSPAAAGDTQKNSLGELPISLIDMLERFLLDAREQHLQGVYSAERRLEEIGRPVSRPTRPYRKVLK